ncbi:MAG: hypothetical protein AVDCRST_MAG73-2895 [uncultured Thermomicrobiales bacterium]|uniref:Uncharacterized protein n=1 Tax=uncultured Thermomicrobiales bacterium TaxID=1645740 RepID=A0A6J4UJQ0_9BACT|nr:MAG: hypothetical protein AVDCRST_MAG73-2895 [uncultured Thermomicrobiales bacterium]
MLLRAFRVREPALFTWLGFAYPDAGSPSPGANRA